MNESKSSFSAPGTHLFHSFLLHHRGGFTIVELLIVIVVIAVLAVITIVAFNGIQERARVSSVTSSLNQATHKLELYVVDNVSYPTALADAEA